MNKIKPRWFARQVQAALRVLPVTVVTGARQTGKTDTRSVFLQLAKKWDT